MNKSTRIIIGIITVAVVVLCLAGCGGKKSITIVNNTGFTVCFLYVSHDSSDDWEEDVLGYNILEDGETFRVSLPSGGKWDIRLEDEDGDSYTKYGVKTNRRTVFTIDDMDD